MSTSLLEARKIRKRFPGTLALDDITIQFLPGEIHALMGENGAGKSTLLNILTGSLVPDEGGIFVKEQVVHFSGPLEAKKFGLAIVHQELSLFPDVSVMENVLVGITPSRFGLMNKKKMMTITRDLLKHFHVNFTVDTIVRDLSVSQQQIVEIVKALAVDADIYIFDEPTSALSVEDAQCLFSVLRDLRNRGKSIIYVSHKFDEIFALSDRISVLRDGKLIGTNVAELLDVDDVIRMMVGRALERIYPPKGEGSREVLLQVSALNAGSKCRNVSFDLYKKEILGVFGLVGSGRTEIMRALTGIDDRVGGNIRLLGEPIVIHAYQDAIKNGIYYLTEDRKQQGLFLDMSIRDDIASVHLGHLSKYGLFNRQSANSIANEAVTTLQVKASSVFQTMGSLSGGNQQKVMIGKWLSMQPRVLILDEPTRGIDVGAKAEIHRLLRRLADEGIGIIVISSELPEVVGLSDRVLVIHDGSVTGTLSGQDVEDEKVMQYASGLNSQII